MIYRGGHHFLQIPGPTNVPPRILRAIGRGTIDHRGPEFASLAQQLLVDLRAVFGTKQPVLIYPASGTGAWEAALVNALSPNDKILMYETGHFAVLWHRMAIALGLDSELIASSWRTGADPRAIEQKLNEDNRHEIKAVCIVHNETSTGVVSPIHEIRRSMDRARHPALLMVDTISSLGSMDYRMDEWGVDVTVAASQKGLMLPPGLCFNAVSERALKASAKARLPKAYWNWTDIIEANKAAQFPYTPATNMLYGLREALSMLDEEGLPNVFMRHKRHAEATRSAVGAWGLQVLCENPAEYSSSVTAVVVPETHDAETLREVILEELNMSLGNGLGKLAGKVFRIGHLGAFNDLMLLGTLAGVQMGFARAGIPYEQSGIEAATASLNGSMPARA